MREGKAARRTHMHSCLYCRSDGPFSTQEHVIPESLGNDDLALVGEVCDVCQRYFGKEVERYVLDKTPLAVLRVLLQLPTKKGRQPSVDIRQQREEKGTIPDLTSATIMLGSRAMMTGGSRSISMMRRLSGA